MSISLQGRIGWRRTAPYHVQLELERGTELLLPPREVELLLQGHPREVKLQGHLVRTFRSDGRLGPGDPVAFKLWVCQPGDAPTGPAFIYFEHFIKARYMEAYLSGNPPDCTLAGYEFMVIDVPSAQPRMTVGQLEEEELVDLVPTNAQSILRTKPRTKPWWKRVLSKGGD